MLWSVLYWVLLSVAVVLLLRGLFWDRAGFRGRPARRCKKCWYDLTGAEGNEDPARRAGPPVVVVCPECGKGHMTTRAMRKTRRGKRWVVAAVVVFVGAGVVRSVPAIQQRGWVAAVPEPVLVLMIPFTDAEPGSSFDQTMWGFNPKPTVWDQLIQEHGRRAWNQPHSWVADRLVFLLARFASDEVITDSTSDRGALYMSRINAAVRRDRAYGFEERWARSVAYAEFRTKERWAPGATVFGELKIRRLVQGVYRVDVGLNVAWFEVRTRGSSVPVSRSGSGPGIRNAAEYVELEQWDQLERMPRIAYGESSTGEMMVSRYRLDPAASGEQEKTVRVRIFDDFGEYRQGTSDWREVRSIEVAYHYVADPDAGPEVVEDQQLADRIDSKLSAELGVRFDRETKAWELVATVREGGLALEESITIGGEISIELRQRDRQGMVQFRRLMRGPKKWWRWVPPTRPPEGMDENSREYWELWREGYLMPSGAEHSSSDAQGIPFIEDGSYVRFRNKDGRLVLRVNTENSNFDRIVYADLKAERVLMGELVIPIRDWTVEELNRYRVSGVVPEHAMP